MRNCRIRTTMWVALLVVGALAVLLAACAAQAPTEKAAPAAPATAPAKAAIPETVTLGIPSDATTLDPHGDISMAMQWPSRNIYDFLVGLTWDMKYELGLAESWKAIDDLTWEFKLRKGVKFHNGEDFNAEVVKFNIERIQNPETKSPYAGWVKGWKVQVADPYIARIVTPTPDATIVATAAMVMMVPPKYLQEKGPTALVNNPVGTGPYKFVEWVKGDRIVLEANKEYWGGEPKVKKVVLKPLPERATRVAALQTGAVDIIFQIMPEEAATLEANPNLKVVWQDQNLLHAFGLNQKKSEPLKDKRVRQAINYAIDSEAIVKELLGGKAIRLAGPFVTFSLGYDPSIKPYPYDPEKAKKLLAEAGYPNGFDMTIDLFTGRYPKGEEMVQAYQGYLAKVGIRAKIVPNDGATYIKKLTTNTQGEGWQVSHGGNFIDPDTIGASILGCEGAYSGYCDPALDALLFKGKATVNEQERKKIYLEAAKLIYENAAYAHWFQYKDAVVYKKSIQWQPRADTAILVFDMFR